ncbi:MAG TPA: cation:proton antiporter [Candidatus Binatia bacterium]|jgi:Kef-type K+ transport system membrane component KefB|nr:cation:proton antiporter [Candidatus Binatia bacterium]
MTSQQLSAAFFLQMFVILCVCRVVGVLARRLGQPQVVGEMIAGVFLGPSLLGLLSPHLQTLLFPPESLKILYVGAQLGVGLYMFLVGVEFNNGTFLKRARSAASVSIAGMVAPFILGAGLAYWLLHVPGLFSERASLFEAMLFLGAALSITAFPMLARIIYERGLTGTALGTLALAAGAIGDAGAWCVLAIVLASFGAGPLVAIKAIAGGIAYGVFVLTLGRKYLARLGTLAERAGQLTLSLLAITLTLFLLAVWITDSIGIHAVFGGFLLGIAMPRGFFARELQRQLEPFAVVFLLPMFFTFSGLNTRLDMVNSPELLLIALAVIAAACLGKGGACWAAARLSGEDNRTALAVGTLMNSRGLMELIIINIGLQKGVIQPALFSIMVLMAIVTTLMASPMFEWVYGRHARKLGTLGPAPAQA